MNPAIFALASAVGRSGVAVARLSGSAAGPIAEALGGPLPPPRQAALRRLVYGGREIDHALLLWFPAPGSFTGEDVAEFHIHGGRAVR
ncbi:MAG TPA: tRNA uridine-5-carboxymethylaminomethyl(34) synthesis GTPase MnmE, partial [Rhizomicrobium sp.]